MEDALDKPFYHGGVAFECQRCSACCRFEPGYVFLSARDIRFLSSHLDSTIMEFTEEYCRKVNVGGYYQISLLEKNQHDCVFWEPGGCSVYRVRPMQCRSYPFWPSILATPNAWNLEARQCPGIGRGRLYTAEEIEYLWKEREPLIKMQS